MKKYYLLSIFFISILCVNGQNITLTELASIRRLNLDEVDDYMVKKGWEFTDASEATENAVATVNYAYKRSNYTGDAVGFLSYMFTDPNDGSAWIWVQINEKNKISLLKKEIKSLGLKMISSYISGSAFIQEYKGASTTFIFRNDKSESNPNTNSSFLITVKPNY